VRLPQACAHARLVRGPVPPGRREGGPFEDSRGTRITPVGIGGGCRAERRDAQFCPVRLEPPVLPFKERDRAASNQSCRSR